MSNFVFALAKAIPFSERASEAGIVTLQGMLMIFAVLAILWAAVEAMHAILHRGDKKEKKPTEKKKVVEPKNDAPATNDAMIAAAIAAAMAASEDDGATVAAITAAISAMRVEEGCTGGFRVVSFKRVPHGRRR